MQQKPKKITKTMPINIILELVPDSVKLLESYGLNCVGCSFNSLDTLEGGMHIHGKSGAEINKIVFELNNLYKMQNQEDQKELSTKELELEIVEDNGKKYNIAGLSFDQATYDALHELSEGTPGLRIRVEAGGCSGYSYSYDFADSPLPDEKTYKFSDKLKLFMNNYTTSKLHGSQVRYESGLHGSGLKFINPNIKNSCHCGKSIGF